MTNTAIQQWNNDQATLKDALSSASTEMAKVAGAALTTLQGGDTTPAQRVDMCRAVGERAAALRRLVQVALAVPGVPDADADREWKLGMNLWVEGTGQMTLGCQQVESGQQTEGVALMKEGSATMERGNEAIYRMAAAITRAS